MLTLDGITLRLGGHLILDKASAALPAGDVIPPHEAAIR